MKNIKKYSKVGLVVIVIIWAIFAVTHSTKKSLFSDNSKNQKVEVVIPQPDEFEMAITNPKTDVMSVAIATQVNKMGKSLLSGDYSTFAKFTYPKVVELIGGEKKMITLMKDQASHTKFVDVSFGNPSNIVAVGRQLQATVPEKIIVNMSGDANNPNAKLMTKSTLIAVSDDTGKSWTFIDTSGKSIEMLKTALPNLSNDLIIAPMTYPTLVQ